MFTRGLPSGVESIGLPQRVIVSGFLLVKSPIVLTHGPTTSTWMLLSGAILAEVTGTMALRAAVDSPAWMALVPVAYLVAFALLGLVLRAGLAIGVAYGIWGAAGVSLTAVLGAVLFDELLGLPAIVGIGLIIVGVVLVESGSRHPADEDDIERHVAAQPGAAQPGAAQHDDNHHDDNNEVPA